MTDTARDERFQQYVASTEQYNAAIKEAGHLPWWEDPAKLAKLEQKMPGISAMPEGDRRRALYHRHTDRSRT